MYCIRACRTRAFSGACLQHASDECKARGSLQAYLYNNTRMNALLYDTCLVQRLLNSDLKVPTGREAGQSLRVKTDL